MVMALTAKNKISFIDGSIPCPESDDLLFGTWIRCNSMVISWILNSVHKDIADSLLYFDTAVGIGMIFGIDFVKVMVQEFFKSKNIL